MIVDVPYDHWATVQRPRRRGPDREVFVSVFLGEVREVASAAAPVAMWWVSPSFKKDRDDLEHTRQVAVRAFEGRLYEPVPGEVGKGVALDEASLATAARKHRGGGRESWKPALRDEGALRSFLTSRDSLGGRASRTVDEETRKRSVFLESDADAGARKVAAKLGRLLLIDGIAYRDVGRPMYALDERSYFAIRPVHATVPSLDWGGLSRPEDYQSLIGRLRADKRGYDRTSIRDLRPDVVAPSLLEFDAERWMATGCANAILRELATSSRNYDRGATRLASYGRDVILSYGRLRDAVAADAGMDVLGARLGEFAEACAPHGTLRAEEAAARAGAARALAASEADAEATASCMAGV